SHDPCLPHPRPPIAGRCPLSSQDEGFPRGLTEVYKEPRGVPLFHHERGARRRKNENRRVRGADGDTAGSSPSSLNQIYGSCVPWAVGLITGFRECGRLLIGTGRVTNLVTNPPPVNNRPHKLT